MRQGGASNVAEMLVDDGDHAGDHGHDWRSLARPTALHHSGTKFEANGMETGKHPSDDLEQDDPATPSSAQDSQTAPPAVDGPADPQVLQAGSHSQPELQPPIPEKSRNGLVRVLAAFGMVLVLGSVAFAVVRGSADPGPMLLVIEDSNRSSYHLLAPGDEPSEGNLVRLPRRFAPIGVLSEDFFGSEEPWGFTENGAFLVGISSEAEQATLIVVDTASRERTDVLESEASMRAYLVGERVVVTEEGEDSDDYFVFDPSSPHELIYLGPGDERFVSQDGRFVALEDHNEVTVFETESGKELFSAEGSVAIFSPDGAHVVVLGHRPVSLYEIKSGDLVSEGPSPFSAEAEVEWNHGDAVLAVMPTGPSAAFMLTTDGEVIEFGSYTEAHFVEADEQDVVLLAGDEVSYFSAGNGQIQDLDVGVDDDQPLVPMYDFVERAWTGILHADALAVSWISSDGIDEVVGAGSGLPLRQAVSFEGNHYLLFAGDDTVEIYLLENGSARRLFRADGSDWSSLSEMNGHVVLHLDAEPFRIFSVLDDEVVEFGNAENMASYLVVDDHLFINTSAETNDVMSGSLDGENAELYLANFGVMAGYDG